MSLAEEKKGKTKTPKIDVKKFADQGVLEEYYFRRQGGSVAPETSQAIDFLLGNGLTGPAIEAIKTKVLC